MPTIAELIKDGATRRCEVDFAGTKLNVEYRIELVTPAAVASLPNRTVEAIARTLSEIIVSWDLIGYDGQPVPATRAGINDVPLIISQKVLDTITTDSCPNPQTGGSFDGGLPPEDNTAPAHTGTRLSKRHATSKSRRGN